MFGFTSLWLSLKSKCSFSLLDTPTVVSDVSHWYFHVGFSEDLQLKLTVGLSPCKNMCYLLDLKPFKNDDIALYFILKALFVLKIIKFLSQLFGYVGKTAWLEI